MRPRFLPGALVNASLTGFIHGPYGRGIVIAVTPANNVPDAAARGLSAVGPWSYWIMTSEVADHPRLDIVGPIMDRDVHPYDFKPPKHRPPR